jgi:hypothetical protein
MTNIQLLPFSRPPFGPGVAAVITQLSNTIIRAIEQDRKVRELDEIEERLAELERRAEDGHQRPAA